MPIIHACSAPDCSTLTMGRYCLDHENLAAAPRQRSHGFVLALLAAVAGVLAAFLARTRLSL